MRSWLESLTFAGVSSFLVALAATLGALAYLWTKWVGPFLARPIGRTIGRAIRDELRELVEEVVTQLLATLLHDLGQLHQKTRAIEERVSEIDRTITEHRRVPHPPPRLGP